MKITIIGTTAYQDRMHKHVEEMTEKGHEVRIPAFDNHSADFDELDICEYNRNLIEWADEIHMFWDGRSIGTIGDFFVAFALRKPVKIIYLESKTIRNVMLKYAEKCNQA